MVQARKHMLNKIKHRLLIGWAIVFGVRLLPFRAPNIEPVMAALMPFSKRYGVLGAFAFGFFSIALFDSITSGIGAWTWVTAIVYGSVGIASAFFFRNRESSPKNYLVFSVVGTLAFDALTGLTIGPIFFAQPLMAALTGQIPFTILHLIGNSVFAVLLSPLIYRWVVVNPKPEAEVIAKNFQPAHA